MTHNCIFFSIRSEIWDLKTSSKITHVTSDKTVRNEYCLFPSGVSKENIFMVPSNCYLVTFFSKSINGLLNDYI